MGGAGRCPTLVRPPACSTSGSRRSGELGACRAWPAPLAPALPPVPGALESLPAGAHLPPQEFENAEGEEYAAGFSAQGSPATGAQNGPDVYVLPLTEVSLPMAKQPGRSGEWPPPERPGGAHPCDSGVQPGLWAQEGRGRRGLVGAPFWWDLGHRGQAWVGLLPAPRGLLCRGAARATGARKLWAWSCDGLPVCWEEGLPGCPRMAAPTRPPEASRDMGPIVPSGQGPPTQGGGACRGPSVGGLVNGPFTQALGWGQEQQGLFRGPLALCPVSSPSWGPPQGEHPQDRCEFRLERLEVNIQAGLQTHLPEAGAVGTTGRVRVCRGRSRADPHLRGSLTSVPAGSEAGPCPPPSAPPGARGKGVRP